MAENSEVGLEDRFISSLDAVKTVLAPYSYRDHDQKLGSIFELFMLHSRNQTMGKMLMRI